MKTQPNNYTEFANLESGSTISFSTFQKIFDLNTSVTVKDKSARGFSAVSVYEIKIGDRINNGTRFIEIVG